MTQVNVTEALLRLAENLASQGRPGEAGHMAYEALAQTLSRESFYTTSVADALLVLGNIDLQSGRLDEAKRTYALALRAQEGAAVQPHSSVLAEIRARLGLVAGMSEDWTASEAFFAAREQGLRSNPETRAGQFYGTLDQAMALLQGGQPSVALSMLDELLREKQTKGYGSALDEAHLLGYRGAALRAAHRNNEAVLAFRAAMPTLTARNSQEQPGDHASFIAAYRTRMVLEAYLDLLSDLAGRDFGLSREHAADEAFMVADLARNSQVQRAITASAVRANLPDPAIAALARSEQDLRARVGALLRIFDRLVQVDRGRNKQRVSELQAEIEQLRKEQRRLAAELAAQHPDYAELLEPHPVSLSELRRALAPDEALFSVYSTARKTFVWTATAETQGFRSVELVRDDLARDVDAVLASVALSDGQLKPYAGATAYRLYARFLAPDSNLWAGKRLLNIIAHGPLAQLPFAALLTAPVTVAVPARYSDWPWLIRRISLAQQPSVSAFTTLRRTSPSPAGQKPFAGFGDPLFMAEAQPAISRGLRMRNLARFESMAGEEYSFPRRMSASPMLRELKAPAALYGAQVFPRLPALPDTAEELGEIAVVLGGDPATDLFLGARATEVNVKSTDLTRYRVIAFATHGLLSGAVAGLDQPALAMANPTLSGDTNNDGLLSLDEILGLKLNADWVVLSACETMSSDGRTNEAASGLGRAFFFAGARSLLLSNWAVETGSARLLTTGLFAAQQRDPRLSRAEALRQSMLQVMGSDMEDYSHPLFWASFSLVGEGGRLHP